MDWKGSLWYFLVGELVLQGIDVKCWISHITETWNLLDGDVVLNGFDINEYHKSEERIDRMLNGVISREIDKAYLASRMQKCLI